MERAGRRLLPRRSSQGFRVRTLDHHRPGTPRTLGRRRRVGTGRALLALRLPGPELPQLAPELLDLGAKLLDLAPQGADLRRHPVVLRGLGAPLGPRLLLPLGLAPIGLLALGLAPLALLAALAVALTLGHAARLGAKQGRELRPVGLLEAARELLQQLGPPIGTGPVAPVVLALAPAAVVALASPLALAASLPVVVVVRVVVLVVLVVVIVVIVVIVVVHGPGRAARAPRAAAIAIGRGEGYGRRPEQHGERRHGKAEPHEFPSEKGKHARGRGLGPGALERDCVRFPRR